MNNKKLEDLVRSLRAQIKWMGYKLNAQQKLIVASGSGVDAVQAMVADIVERHALKERLSTLEQELKKMEKRAKDAEESWNRCYEQKSKIAKMPCPECGYKPLELKALAAKEDG